MDNYEFIAACKHNDVPVIDISNDELLEEKGMCLTPNSPHNFCLQTTVSDSRTYQEIGEFCDKHDATEFGSQAEV
jgi:hypothetical protein